MNWQEVCEHPSLQNLPFKIELDENGKILMSPVKVYHSVYQGEIAALLRVIRKDGKILTECAIKTRRGTKVADVAWTSQDRFEHIRDEVECSIAPEIWIEVLSSTNTDDEMKEKRELYFESGAIEVWICNENGDISFYNSEGKLEQSVLFSKFPPKVET
jgi:Uma2 family endonuclease